MKNTKSKYNTIILYLTKNTSNLITYILSFLLYTSYFLLFTSCTKLELETIAEPYSPASLNEAGGNWNTFVLANGSEISVVKPLDIQDANFVKELDSLKSNVVGKLNETQTQAVNYWAQEQYIVGMKLLGN